MKKLVIFLVMLALMLAPISCFAEAAAETTVAVTESATDETTAAETEAATDGETTSEGFMFEPGNFVSSLQYMGSGMLGIFVVIGLIVIVTIVLNKVMNRGKKQ